MTDAKYDNIADTYKDAMLTGHNDSPSVLDIASHALIDRVGDVARLRLLDIGCGTGTLALYWAERGASVTGGDNSAMLSVNIRMNKIYQDTIQTGGMRQENISITVPIK